MITYEVTAVVDEQLASEFEKYMTGQHIPDVLATGYFLSAEFSRHDGRYRIRYEVYDQVTLDTYVANDAVRLRSDVGKHFPTGLEMSREVWAVLSRVDASQDINSRHLIS